MPRAIAVIAKGDWTGSPADAVLLDFVQRHGGAGGMVTTSGGLVFELNAGDLHAMRGGDALQLDDGRLIEVVAAPEKLIEIRVADADALVRLSWHLGGRHVPVQVVAGKLRLRPDAALENVLATFGATPRAIEAPFEPEGIAYAAARVASLHPHDPQLPHGPDCGCGHAHHDHSHDHSHGHAGHAAHHSGHGHRHT